MTRTQPHFRSVRAKRHLGEAIYRGVYERAPIPFLLLTPELDIIDANDAYLQATMRTRDMLAGLPMFDAFPDNPLTPEANGVRSLSLSFERALKTGAPDAMPIQRYDVIDPASVWEMRYWKPVNWPLFDESGSIVALVHHVSDTTTEFRVNHPPEAPPSTESLIARADIACRNASAIREEVREKIFRARVNARVK